MCARRLRKRYQQKYVPKIVSKILKPQSCCKTQWLQVKGLCSLQTMLQIFVSIISVRNVKGGVGEQLQN